GKLQAISWARTKKIPFLGVCLGMQLAVIEFARNCLNLKDADSTEFRPNAPVPLVIDMPEHNPGNLGGTMRLGIRRTVFKTENSILISLSLGLASVEHTECPSAFDLRDSLFIGLFCELPTLLEMNLDWDLD
ncbi:CTPS2 isoform 4, partial [Pan troglodytes]